MLLSTRRKAAKTAGRRLKVALLSTLIFRFGEIGIAQRDRILDNPREIRVHGGFAVARKGDHIGTAPVALHAFEGGFQLLRHCSSGGVRRTRAVVAVEAAFAIDAIKCAVFSIGRQQVHAQRNTEPTTVYRAEYRRGKEYRRHV